MLEDQLLLGHVEELGGHFRQGLLGHPGGQHGGGSGDEGLAAGRGGAALGGNLGVGEGDMDVLILQAQLLGGNLGHGGGGALPDIGAAHHQVDAGVGQNLDKGAGGVGQAGVADAVVHAAVAAAPALVGGGGHAGRQDLLGLLLDGLQTLEEAHVLTQGLAGGGDGAGPVGVDFADLNGIHIQSLGQGVHLALVGHGHLGHAEAAEGAGHGIVGIVEGGVNPDIGYLIGSGGVHHSAGDNGGAVGGVGAAVAEQGRLHRNKLAVLGGAGLVVHLEGVALGGDHGGLLAAADHLHRAAGVVGQQGQVALDGDVQLAAEAAAGGDLNGYHPVLGEAQHGGDFTAVKVGVLGGAVYGDNAVFIGGDTGVRLDEHVGEHGGLIVVLDDDVALVPGLVHIAVLQVLLLVDVVDGAVNNGGVRRSGVLNAQHGLVLLVLHLDGVQGLLHQLGGLGGHHGDGVAVAADLVVHQHGLVLQDDADAVLAGDVLIGAHGHNTGDGQRGGSVKAFDHAVADGAAEHAAVEHIGQLHVGGKLGLARDLLHGVLFDHALAQDGILVLVGGGDDQVALLLYSGLRFHALAPPFASRAISTAFTILV